MLALVDADSLIYKVCCAIEEKTIWNEQEVAAGIDTEKIITYTTNIGQLKTTFDNYVNNIVFATGTDGYELWLTGSENFRNDNPLGYKENRKDLRKPEGFYELRKHAMTIHRARVEEGFEADDIVVYLKTTYPEDYVLCAIDKDVLYQCEGYHYNYGIDEPVEVTAVEATRFLYWQMLVGDPADGYKGCKGIGKVKATALLKDLEDEYEIWVTTRDTYLAKGMTEEDAINTARLASMHQYKGDGKLILWEPPVDPCTSGLEQ